MWQVVCNIVIAERLLMVRETVQIAVSDNEPEPPVALPSVALWQSGEMTRVFKLRRQSNDPSTRRATRQKRIDTDRSNLERCNLNTVDRE